MIWNKRYISVAHSFLSPSKPHWINYDIDKLRASYDNHQQAALGTRIHALAEEHIKLKIRMPQNTMSVNAFVNDAIGYRMDPEVLLYYSDNAFGTADAISFIDGVLRIFDLKTGKAPGKPAQLETYAALFCLEYGYNPNDIDILLAIYQNDEIYEWSPEPGSVIHIMGRIIEYDKIIEEMKVSYD